MWILEQNSPNETLRSQPLIVSYGSDHIANMVSDDTQISEKEAEPYDRQIRLLGLDAQKRLKPSRVCVLGMSGLGCDV